MNPKTKDLLIAIGEVLAFFLMMATIMILCMAVSDYHWA